MTTQTCNQHEAQSCCQGEQKAQPTATFEPRVDVVETEHDFTLYADLPGVHPENLDVQFDDGQLKIHGKVPPRYEGQSLLHNEYKVGDFTRTFKLGETLDAQRISAELKNGVLTVRLPKVEKAKPRKVEINV